MFVQTQVASVNLVMNYDVVFPQQELNEIELEGLDAD